LKDDRREREVGASIGGREKTIVADWGPLECRKRLAPGGGGSNFWSDETPVWDMGWEKKGGPFENVTQERKTEFGKKKRKKVKRGGLCES